ncbi:MAG: hypothetical protein ACLRIO_02910 [Butyricicoccus sp.]
MSEQNPKQNIIRFPPPGGSAVSACSTARTRIRTTALLRMLCGWLWCWEQPCS